MQQHEEPGRENREEVARQRLLTIRLLGAIIALVGAIAALVNYRSALAGGANPPGAWKMAVAANSTMQKVALLTLLVPPLEDRMPQLAGRRPAAVLNIDYNRLPGVKHGPQRSVIALRNPLPTDPAGTSALPRRVPA